MPFLLEEVAKSYCALKGCSYKGAVGQGAFKEAYRVEMGDGSELALKVYQPSFSAERTAREMEAMVRCSHPQIARLLLITTFDHEGKSYVISLEEFLAGGRLSDRLSGGAQLPITEVIDLGSLLIDAVGHIAQLRLVHRDLKPDNIMFRDAGMTPVVVDFGLVRDLNQTSITVTWLMRGPGTPYFAPPEQLRNEKALIDWRADQFSLGVLLSLTAFGFHPYGALGDDPVVVVERVAERKGPSATFLAQAQAAGLGALIGMVSAYPIQRYRTPQKLADAWPRGA